MVTQKEGVKEISNRNMKMKHEYATSLYIKERDETKFQSNKQIGSKRLQ